MNTDIEDLLREGMERFARDLRAPAGLTRRAAQRRRRRLALRSVTAAAAALAAGAVALVTVVVPGARYDGADATAYVVKRVDSALNAAEPGDIAQMTVTTRTMTPGGQTATTTGEEWSYGGRWRSVTYSSAGHPVYDEGFSASSVYTLVNYPTRTWARQQGPGRPAALASGPPSGLTYSAGGCEPVVAALPLLFEPGLSGLPGIGFPARALPVAVARVLPATVARALRAAISCGTLSVAGRQRVDGIEALKLTSRPGSPISETVWVSPGTYLPVRVVVRWVPGRPVVQQTANITWLPPTARNLATLTVPIPAGFRQVPFAEAVTPVFPQSPGLLPKSAAVCPGRHIRRVGTGSAFPAQRISPPPYPGPGLTLPIPGLGFTPPIPPLSLTCPFDQAPNSR